MNDTTDVTTIFAPLWRRKWLILLIGLVVAGATYEYYKRKAPEFSASTQVDLGSGAEVQQALSGTKAGVSKSTLADAPSLITSSLVAQSVLARLRKEHLRANVKRSEVSAKVLAGTDFITITATGANAKNAARLANYYAEAYIEREHSTYERELRVAINNTRRQLRKIETVPSTSSTTTSGGATTATGAKGKGTKTTAQTKSSSGGATLVQAASLSSKLNQLESEQGLPTVQQVNPATTHSAIQVSPPPKRNAEFGFVIGLLLGGVAVFALSRFDRRIRTLAQVESVFKNDILAALPRSSRPILRDGGQPVVGRSLIEPLRRLHTSLHVAGVPGAGAGSPPGLILCVSADPGDGRSSVVAGLALTQRDAGARVAVLDADLRKPTIAKLLSVEPSVGLAEVLSGRASLEETVQYVGAEQTEAGEGAMPAAPRALSTVLEAQGGSLAVLSGGAAATNPPALLASLAMQDVLRSAAGEFDFVLIDAPPPLMVSDVIPLLHLVDGILIVARLEHTREVSAERLIQLLARTATAPVLGVVANGASSSDIKKYGFSTAVSGRRWPRRLVAR